MGSSYSLDSPIFFASHTVGGCMALICLVTIGFMLELAVACYRDRRERKIRSSVVLYFLIFLLTLVRAVYSFLPAQSWVNLINSYDGNYKQMVCDQIPEVTFLLAYLLAVCSWVETFAKAKSLSRDHRKRYFWIAYCSLSFTIVAIASSIVVIAWAQTWNYKKCYAAYTIFISVIAGIILVFSLVFGLLVLRLFGEMSILTLRMLRQMKRFRLLVAFISTAMALKAVYLLLLSQLATTAWNEGSLSDKNYAVIFFFYFFCVEMLPASMVLVILYYERKASKRRLYHEMQDDSSTSAGSQHNQPAMRPLMTAYRNDMKY